MGSEAMKFDVEDAAPRLIELDDLLEALKSMDQAVLMTGEGAAAFIEERYHEVRERPTNVRSH
jgi:hypothetical protein